MRVSLKPRSKFLAIFRNFFFFRFYYMRTNGENIITRHFEGNFTHTSANLFGVLVMVVVLTAHAEVIANGGVLKVEMP